MTRLCLVALALLLVGACSASGKKDSQKDEGVWDARAVWDFRGSNVEALWRQDCGASVTAVKAQDPCVIQVMTDAGASQPAMEFFRENGYFLTAFLEAGKVDYGRGAAPWINMGRETPQLFLNGLPPVQEASMLIPRDWQQDASYADFAKKQPQAVPWGEYGELIDSEAVVGGGQEFRLEFPLRMCRACADLAYLRMDYSFDPDGALLSAVLAPLANP
jgi:hypothetical protein